MRGIIPSTQMRKLRLGRLRSNIFFLSFWLCWVFVATCGLSLVVASGGYSLVSVCRLLTAVASLAAEHRL